MPRRKMRCGGRPSMRQPSKLISPSVGWNPVTRLNSVVLPSAVGTDEAGDRASPDGEGAVIDGLDAAEGAGDVANVEDRLAGAGGVRASAHEVEAQTHHRQIINDACSNRPHGADVGVRRTW
jgi:hypothetical protein